MVFHQKASNFIEVKTYHGFFANKVTYPLISCVQFDLSQKKKREKRKDLGSICIHKRVRSKSFQGDQKK